ncbi:hypothetical protein AVEN_195168-1 [Araneus ventricosus]|uniref:Uncharacterized protein n=1 Tax=Araneus ventricosus TaxID=182803 RepID=A0A4Y2TAL7_ARAVE|nr:hypothetical protein AVEN_195168-1 [Araneus ventricosus]
MLGHWLGDRACFGISRDYGALTLAASRVSDTQGSGIFPLSSFPVPCSEFLFSKSKFRSDCWSLLLFGLGLGMLGSSVTLPVAFPLFAVPLSSGYVFRKLKL